VYFFVEKFNEAVKMCTWKRQNNRSRILRR